MESGYWSLLAERKQQMPRSYPPEVRRQVVELARAGTKVRQLAKTFAMSDATIYNWLKQDRARPARRHLPVQSARDRRRRQRGRADGDGDRRRNPPEAPAIVTPADGDVQRSATFALTGAAEPVALVEVVESDASRGTTTATAPGDWTLTLTDVGDGEHVYRARATDAASNAGPLSEPRPVRVDTRGEEPPPAETTPDPTETTPDPPATTPAPAAASPAAESAPPAAGRSVLLTPVRGRLRVKLPGGAFAPLERAQQAPPGTVVDARAGAVRVTAAQRAVASGGRFVVRRQGAVTLLRLAACRGRLWVDGRRGFATRSARTTARPTHRARWLTTADCRWVRVRVARGAVRVKTGRHARTLRADASSA
jgi:transposase-like protein